MFLGYLDKKDTENHFQTSNSKIFVNEILLILAELNYNNISFLEQCKTQRLWNNSLIRIDRKPVYFENGLPKEF